MKGGSLSPATRALLDVAKADGPKAAARAKVWGAVSVATGSVAAGVVAAAPSGVALAPAMAATTAASSVKGIVIGALLGSAVTVGLAVAIARVALPGPALPTAGVAGQRAAWVELSKTVADEGLPGPDDRRGGAEEFSRTHEDQGTAFDPMLAQLALNAPVPGASAEGAQGVGAGAAAVSKAVAAKTASTRSDGARSAAARAGDRGVRDLGEDALSREARLIDEAKGALRRGNPEGAITALDAVQRIGSHMEPEALFVRARALRALGRFSEAADVEGKLKVEYPDHPLAR